MWRMPTRTPCPSRAETADKNRSSWAMVWVLPASKEAAKWEKMPSKTSPGVRYTSSSSSVSVQRVPKRPMPVSTATWTRTGAPSRRPA